MDVRELFFKKKLKSCFDNLPVGYVVTQSSDIYVGHNNLLDTRSLLDKLI